MGTLSAWLLLLLLTGCGAIHLDPGRAGHDFTYQGEYAAPGAGAQVVALGDGRFELALYRGGLPGAGWDGSARVRIPGEHRAGGAAFEAEGAFALRDGVLRGTDPPGRELQLARLERRSPTEGRAPPAGAVVLFGEGALDAVDGKHTREGDLAAGATSLESYDSFELHLEFRVPFMPDYRGQRRGNSGVYLQGRYEIQVLDSFGLDEAVDECGALYGQAAPRENMSFPPLSWQTYDVVFRAARFDADGERIRPARVSLRHNGVIVHDEVALTGSMDGGDPEGPGPGPLHLQDLWIPVHYRNIWVLPLEPSP